MKTTVNIWGGIIAMLLALNCFFTYRAAQQYTPIPYSEMTLEQKHRNSLTGEQFWSRRW